MKAGENPFNPFSPLPSDEDYESSGSEDSVEDSFYCMSTDEGQEKDDLGEGVSGEKDEVKKGVSGEKGDVFRNVTQEDDDGGSGVSSEQDDVGKGVSGEKGDGFRNVKQEDDDGGNGSSFGQKMPVFPVFPEVMEKKGVEDCWERCNRYGKAIVEYDFRFKILKNRYRKMMKHVGDLVVENRELGEKVETLKTVNQLLQEQVFEVLEKNEKWETKMNLMNKQLKDCRYLGMSAEFGKLENREVDLRARVEFLEEVVKSEKSIEVPPPML